MLFTGLGLSVLGKTVPEVSSTARRVKLLLLQSCTPAVEKNEYQMIVALVFPQSHTCVVEK